MPTNFERDTGLVTIEEARRWYRKPFGLIMDYQSMREHLVDIRENRYSINPSIERSKKRLTCTDFRDDDIEAIVHDTKAIYAVLSQGVTPGVWMNSYLAFNRRYNLADGQAEGPFPGPFRRKVLARSKSIETHEEAGLMRARVERIIHGLFTARFREVRTDPMTVAAETFIHLIHLIPLKNGNHRTSITVFVNYILLRSGLNPFLLTRGNMARYRNITLGLNRIPEQELAPRTNQFRQLLTEQNRQSSG